MFQYTVIIHRGFDAIIYSTTATSDTQALGKIVKAYHKKYGYDYKVDARVYMDDLTKDITEVATIVMDD